MTLAEAQEICGPKWLQFPRRVPFLSYMHIYPELSLLDMAILEFLLIFTHWEHVIRQEIEGKQYYWCNYSTVLAHIWCADCSSTSVLQRHINFLCGENKAKGDEREFFLQKKTVNTQHGKRVFLSFTQTTRCMYGESVEAVRVSNKAISDTPVEVPFNTPPEIAPSVWIPSQELITFRDTIYSRTDRFSGDGSFFKKDKPVKYWQMVEKYIESLQKGDFVEKYCKTFTTTPVLLPPIELESIIDAVLKASINKSKHVSVNEAFVAFNAKHSPLYSYLHKITGGVAKKQATMPLPDREKTWVMRIWNHAEFEKLFAASKMTEAQFVNLCERFFCYTEDNATELQAINRGYRLNVSHAVDGFLQWVKYKIEGERWKETPPTLDDLYLPFMVGNTKNVLWREYAVWMKDHFQHIKVTLASSVYSSGNRQAEIDAEMALELPKIN